MHTNRVMTDVKNPINAIIVATLTALLIAPVASESQPRQDPVVLGSAGGFAVLAASLISSVPTSDIVGNVGLSPAAGSEITGLTAVEVDGFIYTVDETGPAGSRMAAELLTSAQGDLTVAYNDAADRRPVPVADFLNPGSGDIGGMTLEPGLYKFTDAASITESNVTLSGDENDVWIFMIAADLNVGSDIHVTLDGGARASNIFWQVGTSATLGTASVFKGTIMADQSISLATGATAEGRLLARIAAVTLDAATITHPGEPTAVLKDGVKLPQKSLLLQNYPNPFNASTRITIDLAKRANVKVIVIDLAGNPIATLVDRELNSGVNTAVWNASGLASGTYFIKMESGGFQAMRQISLIR